MYLSFIYTFSYLFPCPCPFGYILSRPFFLFVFCLLIFCLCISPFHFSFFICIFSSLSLLCVLSFSSLSPLNHFYVSNFPILPLFSIYVFSCLSSSLASSLLCYHFFSLIIFIYRIFLLALLFFMCLSLFNYYYFSKL